MGLAYNAAQWSEHWAKREIFDHFTPPRFAKRRGGVPPRQVFF
jgi:phospholipase C